MLFVYFIAIVILFILAFSIGMIFANQLKVSPSDGLPLIQPKKTEVAVLVVSFVGLDALIFEKESQDMAGRIVRLHQIASASVLKFGGVIEKLGPTSFIASWGTDEADGSEIWSAIRCGIDLRVAFLQEQISYHMGVHIGKALAIPFRALVGWQYSVLGEPITKAFQLKQQAQVLGVDLIVSTEAWQKSETRFIGDPVNGNPEEGFFIEGYLNEQGDSVLHSFSRDPVSFIQLQAQNRHSPKWLVNNGTQMLGPLTINEISSRLFTQDLDFDSPVWKEGSPQSKQVRDAGIFDGSDDPSARFWFFDGSLIHGPHTRGFLKTALDHAAIPQNIFICESSTVNGWKTVEEWNSNAGTSESEFAQQMLYSSLAPPTSRSDSHSVLPLPSSEKKVV